MQIRRSWVPEQVFTHTAPSDSVRNLAVASRSFGGAVSRATTQEGRTRRFCRHLKVVS
jgi:hypothetical protein